MPLDATLEKQPAPALGPWSMAAVPETNPLFNDARWSASPQPLQMGADGDYGAFVWYRASVDAPAAGPAILHAQLKDNGSVFVNGRLAQPERNGFRADFKAGKNSVAIFVSHHGRNKVFSYLGDLPSRDPKGIVGPVTLELAGAKPVEIANWRMQGGEGADPSAVSWTAPGDTGGVPALVRTVFQAPPPGETGPCPVLRFKFTGLSRGMVYLNGHALGRYPEKIRVDSIYLPECWLRAGGNDLVVFDETGAHPDRAGLVVEKEASRELIRLSESVSATTPIVVPQENPPRDLPRMNLGNLAYRAPAFFVGEAAKLAPVREITDGDPETRWKAPKNSVHPAVQVDLGASTAIGACEILWDQESRRYKYTVEGSEDGVTWKHLGDQTTAVPTSPDSPSSLSRLILTGHSFRHLRVTLLDAKSWSIAEIRAFKPGL